jgi:8-oxo-dGDP phosphatase
MRGPKPWKTLSSRYVVENGWLNVRADECVTAEGRPVSPYFVVEVPDFVHIAAVTAASELVMVRQYRQGSRLTHLELPAGVIDPGDADAAAAASRELREETGYEAGPWRTLAVWHSNPARQTNRQHLLLAQSARLTSAQQLDGVESLTVELLPLRKALSAIMSGDIDSALHVAAVFRVLAELEGAEEARRQADQSPAPRPA